MWQQNADKGRKLLLNKTEIIKTAFHFSEPTNATTYQLRPEQIFSG
jgi:tmRNA-binding protein